MSKIDIQRLFAEDGGRAYIISLYPDSEQSFENPNRKFALRPEKTPSASLKRMESGEWGVTDFGDDSKWRNAIALAIKEFKLEYGDAIRAVAEFYNYKDDTINLSPKPVFEERPARPDEAEGQCDVEFKEFEAWECRVILTDSAWNALDKFDELKRFEAAKSLFQRYHLKCLHSYTTVKNGKALKRISTTNYPMFYYDEGDWGKIYLPKAEHKNRFRYRGKKPAHYIHGLKQAQDFIRELRQKKLNEQGTTEEFESSAEAKEKEIEQMTNVKLPELIRCSGGSDALNVAALGYRVLWQNSESEQLDDHDMKLLRSIAWNVYNLPDIDTSGRKNGHELGMKFLDLKTIWLPDELLKLDADGKATSKDLRDWLRSGKKKFDFDRLVATAIPYRFWDEERQLDSEGKPKYKFGRPLFTYKFNHVQAYNFLHRNGFARYKSEREKEGYFYIKIDDNIVTRIEANVVKNFIHSFLKERALVDDTITQDLQNAMYTSNQLSVSNLVNLPLVELDFKSYGADFQYFFFPEHTWKITKTGIDEARGLVGGKYVWADKVIEYPTKNNEKINVKKLKPFFEAQQIDDSWHIKLLDKSCMFFRFIIQTARVHWRKELEERPQLYLKYDTPKKQEEYALEHGLTQAERELFFARRTPEQVKAYLDANKFEIGGALLTEEERKEQVQHLVNRIYTLGYMLHRYKDPARAWCVWAMDNKLSELAGEDAKSNGGSGKSLTGKALKWFWRNNVGLSGRNPLLTKNPHVYDKVSKQTDLIIIDDCYEYLDFGFFYGDITGDMNPNPKQTQSYSIPFDESPKFWFDSNFGDRDFSESTQRRKLVTSFSDYYHENNGSYLETRSPSDDFGGRRLFYDFTANDWSYFFNFMAQCLHFYLAVDAKIKPPMRNLAKRNLLSAMGGRFFEWAEVFFAHDSGRLNAMVCKKEAKEEYMNSEKIRELSTQKFTEYLKKYAEYHGYVYNPTEYQNSQGRIMRDHNGKKEEMIFYRTVSTSWPPETETTPEFDF